MTRRIVPLLVVVGILSCTCAWAQNDTSGTTDNTPPAQPGPKPAYTYPDTTPSLDFLTGSIENSSISLGANAGFAYDSNGYPNSNSNQSRWLTNVGGSVRIQQFLPKISWNVGYSGGLQLYHQISGSSSNSNLFGQSASGGVIWQFARHWQLLANDSYGYSADPFESFLTIPGAPTANNPNAIAYYPLTQFTTNIAIVTLTKQLTKRDTMSFTGSASLRQTSNYNVVSTVPFYNLDSYSGRINYNHVLSPRLSLGGGYSFNSLDFGHGQQRSGIQTISLTVDYLLRPNMTITGWIGPQYTSTKTSLLLPNPFPPPPTVFFVTYDSLWSTALGLTFGWRSGHNSVRAGYTRSVSDGGGITATSQVNIASASYNRLITRKLNGVVGFHFLNSTSTTLQSRSFDNYFISVGLNYQIMKSLQASANYVRAYQTQSSAFLINPGTYTDNRVGGSISYHWSHPLGR